MNYNLPFKLSLNIADINKHVYRDFKMTFSQDSELERDLLSKVLAFSYFAHEDLKVVTQFSRSATPCIWQRNVIEEIEQWIEIKELDEKELRKALSLSSVVKVFLFDDEKSRKWSEKIQQKFKNSHIEVYCYKIKDEDYVLSLLKQSMRLNAYIEDNIVLLSDDDNQLEITVEKIL